jgi:hypothetical protein
MGDDSSIDRLMSEVVFIPLCRNMDQQFKQYLPQISHINKPSAFDSPQSVHFFAAIMQNHPSFKTVIGWVDSFYY